VGETEEVAKVADAVVEVHSEALPEEMATKAAGGSVAVQADWVVADEEVVATQGLPL